MEWLKDKTLGKIRRWYLRKVMRFIGEINKERLHKISENTPPELKKYAELAKIMNSNATSLHNLYKEAKDDKKFHEAFLYFFYEFEINLKHAIMSEMMVANSLEMLKQGKDDYFLVYPRNKVVGIQKNGDIKSLIEKFSQVHGNEIEENLIQIKEARNFIIHNMLKEKMSEEQIKKSFEYFFTVTNGQINKVYSFFLKVINEREEKLSGAVLSATAKSVIIVQ